MCVLRKSISPEKEFGSFDASISVACDNGRSLSDIAILLLIVFVRQNELVRKVSLCGIERKLPPLNIDVHK